MTGSSSARASIILCRHLAVQGRVQVPHCFREQKHSPVRLETATSASNDNVTVSLPGSSRVERNGLRFRATFCSKFISPSEHSHTPGASVCVTLRKTHSLWRKPDVNYTQSVPLSVGDFVTCATHSPCALSIQMVAVGLSSSGVLLSSQGECARMKPRTEPYAGGK